MEQQSEEYTIRQTLNLLETNAEAQLLEIKKLKYAIFKNESSPPPPLEIVKPNSPTLLYTEYNRNNRNGWATVRVGPKRDTLYVSKLPFFKQHVLPEDKNALYFLMFPKNKFSIMHIYAIVGVADVSSNIGSTDSKLLFEALDDVLTRTKRNLNQLTDNANNYFLTASQVIEYIEDATKKQADVVKKIEEKVKSATSSNKQALRKIQSGTVTFFPFKGDNEINYPLTFELYSKLGRFNISKTWKWEALKNLMYKIVDVTGGHNFVLCLGESSKSSLEVWDIRLTRESSSWVYDVQTPLADIANDLNKLSIEDVAKLFPTIMDSTKKYTVFKFADFVTLGKVYGAPEIRIMQ